MNKTYIKSFIQNIKYTYWRFRQTNFNDYFFINAKTLMIFAIIFIVNLLIFKNKISFSIRFPSLENSILTIEVLIRSIVVLLSIIISFTLLSFQIFNKYFGRFAFLDFFKKRHLKVIFTLFLLNVIFLIYVQTYLKDCNTIENFDSYAKLIFIEAILFSIGLVMSLFPIMINLLSHSQSRTNLHNLFSSISEDEIYYTQSLFRIGIDTEEYETNSFKIISEIGLAAIKDYDHSSFELIIRNIYLTFKSIIDQEKEEELKRRLYYKFTEVLNDYFDFASKEKNTSALNNILSCRCQLEQEVLQQEPPIIKDNGSKYYGWDFNFNMEKFFDKSIQYNEDSISSEVVDNYRDFIIKLIETKFPNQFVYNYKTPFNDTHHTSIISQNFSLIKKFHSLAGQQKKTTILKSISNLFSTLDLTILGSNNHIDTKKFLLQVNNENKLEYLRSLVEEANVKNIESLFYPYGFGLEKEIMDLNTAIVFRSSLRAVDYLFQKGAINNSILNELKTNTMHFINLYEKQPKASNNLITLSINKFDYLRGLIIENDSDEKKDIYLKLFRYFGYINSDYDNHNIVDENLSNKFKTVSANFTLVQRFEADLEKKGYIQNRGII